MARAETVDMVRWCYCVTAAIVGVICGCNLADDAVTLPDASFPDAARGGCEPGRDSDGDGIADAREGGGDRDGDGVLNTLDEDSDGDGTSDAEERRSDAPCGPADSDADAIPDFLDPDSDDDGLSDADELDLGTDPVEIDTDGDGVTDFGELRGTGTDPLDPLSTISPDDFFVELPYRDPPVHRRLTFGTAIHVADVFFLVDCTSSMLGERETLIRTLTETIVPGLRAVLRDVHVGVGGLDDYPVDVHGGRTDLPFYVLHEIVDPGQDRGQWSLASAPCPSDAEAHDLGRITGLPNGVADVLDAVMGLPCHWGADGPESYVSALYSTATGLGLSWPSGSLPEYGLTWPAGSIPERECPSGSDDLATRRGYPCFRPGALPIVLLIGDADFHNGVDGAFAYSFDAPGYEEAADALRSIGARVIGIHSFGGSGGRASFEAIARETGAVRPDGSPLVFEIGATGAGLDDAVVRAVAELVGATPQDVTTRTRNVPGNPDDFDATRFITRITPIEGYLDGVAGSGYVRKDETTFYSVTPGAVVELEVELVNDVRPEGRVAEIFRARILVVGNETATLDSRDVYIVVPPAGGTVLI